MNKYKEPPHATNFIFDQIFYSHDLRVLGSVIIYLPILAFLLTVAYLFMLASLAILTYMFVLTYVLTYESVLTYLLLLSYLCKLICLYNLFILTKDKFQATVLVPSFILDSAIFIRLNVNTLVTMFFVLTLIIFCLLMLTTFSLLMLTTFSVLMLPGVTLFFMFISLSVTFNFSVSPEKSIVPITYVIHMILVKDKSHIILNIFLLYVLLNKSVSNVIPSIFNIFPAAFVLNVPPGIYMFYVIPNINFFRVSSISVNQSSSLYFINPDINGVNIDRRNRCMSPESILILFVNNRYSLRYVRYPSMCENQISKNVSNRYVSKGKCANQLDNIISSLRCDIRTNTRNNNSRLLNLKDLSGRSLSRLEFFKLSKIYLSVELIINILYESPDTNDIEDCKYSLPLTITSIVFTPVYVPYCMFNIYLFYLISNSCVCFVYLILICISKIIKMNGSRSRVGLEAASTKRLCLNLERLYYLKWPCFSFEKCCSHLKRLCFNLKPLCLYLKQLRLNLEKLYSNLETLHLYLESLWFNLKTLRSGTLDSNPDPSCLKSKTPFHATFYSKFECFFKQTSFDNARSFNSMFDSATLGVFIPRRLLIN